MDSYFATTAQIVIWAAAIVVCLFFVTQCVDAEDFRDTELERAKAEFVDENNPWIEEEVGRRLNKILEAGGVKK